MKTIYLFTDGIKTPFQYSELSELKSEFEKRNILIGNNCTFGKDCAVGDYCSIGDRCSIGGHCSIGDRCSIGYGCWIGDRCSIGYGCWIGDGCSIGYGCSIGDRCLFGYGCWIGEGCWIGNHCSIGEGCSIGDGCSIRDETNIAKTILLQGTKHQLSFWFQGIIKIGCFQKPIEKWERVYESIGNKEGYTPDQIAEYRGYIEMCKNLQPQIVEA